MKLLRITTIIFVAVALAICVTACGGDLITTDFINAGDLLNGPTTINELPSEADVTAAKEYSRRIEPQTGDFERIAWTEVNYAEITLADNASEVTKFGDYGEGVDIKDNVITITEGGYYKLSGKLSDGRVVVAKNDKICVILDGVDISCSTSAPMLFLKNGLKVLTLASGSENKLVDCSVYSKYYDNDGNEMTSEAENKINGCLYSQHELVINGEGSLTVEGKAGNAISGKSRIKIASGNITVSAASNGIKAKAVEIEGGTVTVTKAGNDGIKSIIDTNAEEGTVGSVTQLTGYLSIVGGTVDVTASCDGIQAETMLRIDGSTTEITVNAGGGSTSVDTEGLLSKKGLKSSGYLLISGGDIDVNSSDDSLHGDLGVIMEGGSCFAKTAQKGVNSVDFVRISGGRLDVDGSDDGIEAQNVVLNGGTVMVSANSNGIKCEYPVEPAFEVLSDCALIVDGEACVSVNASGDAIESDGAVLLAGGSLYVDGPANAQKAVIKADGGFVVNGGNLIACGNLGMVQDPVAQSTQCSIALAVNKPMTVGMTVRLCDANGKVLLSRELATECRTVMFSDEKISTGSKYTLYVGDTVAKTFTVENILSLIGANI